ncbi:MAG: ABC transporter ATP-binding protein [Phycisphaerales bacterium]
MLIRIRQLSKVYVMQGGRGIAREEVHALRGVDLDIAKNEFVAIMGASGSGKSTLMNIIGCLDKPTGGSYELNDKGVHKMSAAQLSRVRNEEIGFVFQSFELLGRATALKNVMLPLVYSRRRFWGSKQRAKEALTRVGLGDRMGHKPNQLSGGQKQRVAIARALVNGPSILLADEPTGALDSKTSEDIMALFEELHAQGQTVILVTHEEDIAGFAKRIVRLKDGRIVSDNPTNLDPIHQDYLRRSLENAQKAAGANMQSGMQPDREGGLTPSAPTSVPTIGDRP